MPIADKRLPDVTVELESKGSGSGFTALLKGECDIAMGKVGIAFVPYSQIAGVVPGAPVYTCRLWGMLGCTRVGTVAEVLAGEVVAQDPWGQAARGEYALLDLTDRSAAQAKSLRVRGSGKPGEPARPSEPPFVSPGDQVSKR